SREEAEDLVQETYLRAFRAWRAHRRPEKVEAWLATICLNVVRSEYRWRSRRPAEQLAADPASREVAEDDTAVQALNALR
ncbi:MAG: RNA polymerase sigma factor, partial [Actinomycetota bacterium]